MNEENEIFKKLDTFKVDMAKATCQSDLRSQVFDLGRVLDNFETYLQNELQQAEEDSIVIGVVIGQLRYIKRKFIDEFGRPFIKDERKKIRDYIERIESIKWWLKHQLDVTKSYVVDGKIIMKKT